MEGRKNVNASEELPFFRFHILLTTFHVKKENWALKLFPWTFIHSLYLVSHAFPDYPVCLSFANGVNFSLK